MQKRKLVAIVLALAMILSTFGTIPVFAAGIADHGNLKVSVDKDFVLTDTPTMVKATFKEGVSVTDKTVFWTLYLNGAPTTIKGTTSSGTATVPINAGAAAGDVYYVIASLAGYPGTIDTAADGVDTISDITAVGGVDYKKNAAKVQTKYNVTVSSVSISAGDTSIITGTVKDGNGDEVEGADVYLYTGDVISDADDAYLSVAAGKLGKVEAGGAVASGKTASNGTFAVVSTFDDASDWAIGIGANAVKGNDIVYASGKVAPEESLDVSVDTDTIKSSETVADKVVVTVEDEDGAKVADAVVVLTGIEVKAVTGIGADIYSKYVTNGAGVGIYTALQKQAFIDKVSKQTALYGVTGTDGKVTFEAPFTKVGEATVKVYWEDTTDGGTTPSIVTITGMAAADARDEVNEAAWDNSGEATFDVAASDAINMSVTTVDAVAHTALDLDMATVGAGKTYDISVNFWDSLGNGVDKDANDADYDGIKEVTVYLTGCGFDKDEDVTADGQKAYTWNGVNPKVGGVLTAKVAVTFHDGTKQTITKDIDVEGWQLTVTPADYSIDTEYNFKAVVTDADGKPVNYANVKFMSNFTGGAAIPGIKYVDDGKWVTLPGSMISAGDKNINDGVYAETVKFADAADVYVCVYNALTGDLQAYKKIEVFGDNVYTVTLEEPTIITNYDEDLVLSAKDANGDPITDDTCVITIDDVDHVKGAAAGDYSVDTDDETYTIADFSLDEAGDYTVYFKNSDGSEIGKATLKVVDAKVELGIKDALTDSVKEDLNVKVYDPRDNSLMDGDMKVKMSASGAFFNMYTSTGAIIDRTAPAGTYDEADIEADYTSARFGDEGLKVTVMAWDDEDNDVDAPEITVEVSLDNGATWTEIATLAVKPISFKATPDKIAVDADNLVTIEVKDARGAAWAEKAIYLSGAVSAESETDKDGKVSFLVKPNASGTVYMKVETDRKDNATGTGGDKVLAEGKFQAVIGSVPGGTGVVKIELMVGRTDAVANGKVATLDVAPFIENGRTLMPFRFIGEALGAKVEWIAAGNKVTFTSADGKIVIELVIGSADAKVNGVAKTLDVPAKVVNGRTVVPVRFISENMGCYVDWNFATNAITITK